MRPSSAPLERRLALAALLGLALAAALIAAGLLLARPRIAQSQDLGLAISKTLRGGQVVQIGQILEFSIRITNTGTLPIVELDLADEFVGAIVAPSGAGPFAKPGDPPLSDTEPYTYDGGQTIRWSLLGGGSQLGPGEALEVIVRLRAVRPSAELTTVNRARIERAIRSNGENSGGGSAEVPARPSGARLPMTKTLGAPAPVAAGLPITFTITITNDGAVDMLSLPLRDVYNPAALGFVSANPPPLSVDAARGVLLWDDLLAISGRERLRPGESITVVTAYTALRDITAAVNRAEVSGARDEYGNDAQPSQAEAPIRIVGPGATTTPDDGGDGDGGGGEEEAPTEAPTATPTPFRTAGPRLTEIAQRTASAQATPTLPATPTAEATATPAATTLPVPATLPNTGAGEAGGAGLVALAALVGLVGLFVLGRLRG
jgi:hypothetical protein